MNHNKSFLSIMLLCTMAMFLFSSCHGQVQTGRTVESSNQEQTKETLIDANKNKILEEKVRIDNYIQRNNYIMVNSPTGVRTMIIENGKGIKPKLLSDVSLHYRINLLDGSYIYSSDSSGVLSFILGQSNEPSGLQEALLGISEGSKAIIIVPYYLAYGLTGDGDKIRGGETLVYQIELIKVRSN